MKKSTAGGDVTGRRQGAARQRSVPRIATCAVGCLIAVGAGAAGADRPAPPELVTDRPDQTESTAVLPPGFVQLETGWSVERFGGGEERVETVQAPGTLVRLGVGRGVELRLAWDGHFREDTGSAGGRRRNAGAGDAGVGAKFRLWSPDAALLVAVSLPVGERGFSTEGVDPSFRFAFARDLAERVGFGVNLGMSWTSEPGDGGGAGLETRSFGEYTATLGFALGGRLGAFVEAFGALPVDAPGGPAHSLDGGLTWRLRPNLQLDAYGGVGLSSSAPDRFVGVGVAFRLPR